MSVNKGEVGEMVEGMADVVASCAKAGETKVLRNKIQETRRVKIRANI